jgi:hypothetical protein
MSNIVGPPLYYAVKHNHLEAARLLLERGANSRRTSVNMDTVREEGRYTTSTRSYTYIVVTAIENRNAKMTDLLFDYGAKLNNPDLHLENMLFARNVDMVECILRRWNYAYYILPYPLIPKFFTRRDWIEYLLNAVKTRPFCLKCEYMKSSISYRHIIKKDRKMVERLCIGSSIFDSNTDLIDTYYSLNARTKKYIVTLAICHRDD